MNKLQGGSQVKHIVFYSGGIGSWATAKRVIARQGKENVVLLFTDTLIEDHDLYRFIDETVREMDVDLIWLEDGRTPWEVFKDVRYLGNSRIAQCSHLLKQKPANDWIKTHFKPEDCILYLGIDWSESHRTKAPLRNYASYRVEFPMCEEPFRTKSDLISELEELGIEQPRLYKKGFAHNNCGGFCVRAGQGHFAHLLKELSDLYKHHEIKEQEMREFLDKDVSILRRTRNGEKINLTLRQLREEVECKKTDQIDMFDIGGCGCFVE
nr:phosphoadenosine phosphosulfate reductase family protein [Roseburia sp. 1XD42-34]